MPERVLITGAASGIGLATVQRMQQAGWQVLAGVLPDEDTAALDALSPALRLQLDITQPEHVQAAYAKLADAGHLNALVNSAGINLPGTLETTPIEQIQQVFAVNVFGHLRLIQALLPLLKAAQGRIVNVSSLMGRAVMPTLGAYSMSKHALEAMTDVLRLELAASGVKLATVLPGAVATPMTDGMADALKTAFAQLDDGQQAQYATLYADMGQALEQQAKRAVPPTAVAEAIHHALTARQPRPRYAVGTAAAGLLLMRRLAPDVVSDAILKRALGLSG